MEVKPARARAGFILGGCRAGGRETSGFVRLCRTAAQSGRWHNVDADAPFQAGRLGAEEIGVALLEFGHCLVDVLPPVLADLERIKVEHSPDGLLASGAVLGQHILHRAIKLDLCQLLSRFPGLSFILGLQVVQLIFQLVSIGRFLRQLVNLRDLGSQRVLGRFRRRLVRLDFCVECVQQRGYYFIRSAFTQNVLDLFAFHVVILLYDFITAFSRQDSAFIARRRKTKSSIPLL